MYKAVKEDMDPAIAYTSDWNKNKDNAILMKNKFRASSILREMMGKNLFTYFMQWKAETDAYRITL